jgi:hypothetical protein
MFSAFTSLRGSRLLRLAAFLVATICGTGCDWSNASGPPAQEPCKDTRIDIYIRDTLHVVPDSILVVCHPLPKAK